MANAHMARKSTLKQANNTMDYANDGSS